MPYYYPKGGMDDFQGSFNTIEECLEAAEKYLLDDYCESLSSKEEHLEYKKKYEFWTYL